MKKTYVTNGSIRAEMAVVSTSQQRHAVPSPDRSRTKQHYVF